MRSIWMRQHQRDLLGCGEQDVGRQLALTRAPRRRRVAGPRLQRDGKLHLRDGIAEVPRNIDGERLQRRDIKCVDQPRGLAGLPCGKVNQARQKAGERLAGAGGGDQQRIATVFGELEQLQLVGMRAPATPRKPGGKGLREARDKRRFRPSFVFRLQVPLDLRRLLHQFCSRGSIRDSHLKRPADKGDLDMERLFGGNPALVLIRLVVLSLVVGVVLTALGFSPYDIIDSIRELFARTLRYGLRGGREGVALFPARGGDRVPGLANRAAVQADGPRDKRRRGGRQFAQSRRSRGSSAHSPAGGRSRPCCR